ncbi:MAG: hypothetical protein QG663_111 [Thermodesulfobacteriota bacterium]|nr:hypothetical protein [Thermodesulfobacteriota bacterium]
MPNIDELVRKYGGELGSVLPLLLLFAFWWIFSMLGSRFKKTGEKSEEPDSPGLQDRILQMMSGAQDENGDTRPQKPGSESYGATSAAEQGGFYQGPIDPTGEIKPKPINPRWWGA